MLLLFVVVTSISMVLGLSNEQWKNYHYYYFFVMVSISFIIAIWLGIGGLRDIIRLFRDLKKSRRDVRDDGSVSKEWDKAKD